MKTFKQYLVELEGRKPFDKISDLLEMYQDDEKVRDEIRDTLIRDFGETITGELTQKEIKVISQGSELWELSLDDIESKTELDLLDKRFKFRFVVFDHDSGLARIYSSSKQKLVDAFKFLYRNTNENDIIELEDDGYLQKVA